MKKIVGAPVLNLYADSNESSEVVAQALYGWNAQVMEEVGAFSRIQMDDGYQGWVPASQLHLPQQGNGLSKAVIKHNAAHVYETPHVNRKKPILTLPFEVELSIAAEPADEDFRWIQVLLVTGQLAWIQRGHVWTRDFPSFNLKETLQLSRQFLGLPYTWGGRSSFGYDCSGFVQMLFKQMKISLPRDACQQILHPLNQAVEWQDRKEGDLLFFGSGPSSIKHVGICLGEELLIHASVKPVPLLQIACVDEPSLLQRFNYRSAHRLLINE